MNRHINFRKLHDGSSGEPLISNERFFVSETTVKSRDFGGMWDVERR